MSGVALLDVNVLVALLYSRHQFHPIATAWFKANGPRGWATCPLTQAGFVRTYCRPAVIGARISVEEAVQLLDRTCRHPAHTFWSQDTPLADLDSAIRSKISGHKQISDAVLLDLAIRRGGILVTFDRRLTALAPGSRHILCLPYES